MHRPAGAPRGDRVRSRTRSATRMALAVAGWMLAAWAGLALALFGAFETTDYRRDWSKLTDLAAGTSGESPVNQAMLAAQRYWLSATPGDRATVEQRLTAARRAAPDSPALRMLEARWAAHHHKPAEAAVHLAELAAQANWDDAPSRLGLAIDIALQQGRIEDAQKLLTESARQTDWALLAQYALLMDKTGQTEQADRAYQDASDLLSSKAMRDFAWLELQRGYLALSHGDAGAAETHYRLALRAYSGYWLAADYWGEWLAAQRRYAEAVAVYRQLALCTRKPEFYQSLGDLYQFLGQAEPAKYWHDKALDFYLDATRNGQTQYYHHLAALYADAYLDGTNASAWARLDLEQRPNAMSHDALAWALFRDGQIQAAVAHARAALSYRWEDAHLYGHAGMILLAAGFDAEGRAALERARQINPHYDDFHAHR